MELLSSGIPVCLPVSAQGQVDLSMTWVLGVCWPCYPGGRITAVPLPPQPSISIPSPSASVQQSWPRPQ